MAQKGGQKGGGKGANDGVLHLGYQQGQKGWGVLDNWVLPGDWECANCLVLNFARRVECVSCGRVREGGVLEQRRVMDHIEGLKPVPKTIIWQNTT